MNASRNLYKKIKNIVECGGKDIKLFSYIPNEMMFDQEKRLEIFTTIALIKRDSELEVSYKVDCGHVCTVVRRRKEP